VALVLNGSSTLQADALAAYLDGTKFASGSGSQLWAREDDIGIGRVDGSTKFHTGNSGKDGDGFAGMIDDVRVYNRVLSASEVSTLASETLTVPASSVR
jgi:hypothetical protein